MNEPNIFNHWRNHDGQRGYEAIGDTQMIGVFVTIILYIFAVIMFVENCKY